MRILILLIAAAVCGQAQTASAIVTSEVTPLMLTLKASVGCFLQDGTPIPCQKDFNRADGTDCRLDDLLTSDYVCVPPPPSLESRIEKLEKAVAKLTTAQPSAYLPSSHITVWDAAARTTRILTLAEANALLVALAKAINESADGRVKDAK